MPNCARPDRVGAGIVRAFVDGRCDGNTVHADQLHSDLQSHTLCTGSGAKLRHDGAVALPLGPDIETGGDQPGGRREIDVE